MTLLCETCGQVVTECDALTEAEAVLVAAHARDHQAPHCLSLARVPDGTTDYAIDCLKCGTGMRARIPQAYVGAVTICFHSEHEGHRVRLVIDGRQLYPPE